MDSNEAMRAEHQRLKESQPSKQFRGCIQAAGQKEKDTKVGLKAAKNSEVEGNGLKIRIKHVAEE